MKIAWNKMRTALLARGLALVTIFGMGLSLLAGETRPADPGVAGVGTKNGGDNALLGSPDFHPSPEHPVGWRGDGSGRFPGANPPLHWGRTAKSVRALRSQATKPKEGETGKPISDGVVREWLILGPVLASGELKRLDKDVLPDEAKMEPSEGEKVGDLVWKRLSPDSQTLDFRALFGAEKPIQAVAYACAYVYCESAQNLYMGAMSSGHRLLVNGVPPKEHVSLQKGWNRLLIRVQPAQLAEWGSGPEPLWYLRSILYGGGAAEYETENVAWCARLPGTGISTPIIVGDRIFVTTNYSTICCLNKLDGQLLWMRTFTLYDVATEEEKKTNPQVFQEIAPLAAKLTELDLSVKPGASPSAEPVKSKMDLEQKIVKLMAKVDRKKYAIYPNGEGGGSSAATPTSDGRNVYVTFQPYLNVCLDMDGNTQWVNMHAWVPPYDGRESHGLYTSSVLLDGKLMVCSDRAFALDAKTGKLVWQSGTADPVILASLLSMTMEQEPLLVTPYEVLRARDGKQLFCDKQKYYYGCFGTPVIAEGRIFRLFARGEPPGTTVTDMIRLPASAAEPFKAELVKGIKLDANRFPRWYGGWFNASPLYHEGLLYCMSEDGVLFVMDAGNQSIVYQKLLDLDLEMAHSGNPGRGGGCSSPALAGKYLYVFGNHGTCLVIEPGRTFGQVARNRVENTSAFEAPFYGAAFYPEITISCPVFEGKRLYYRGLSHLYCIEEKQ